MPLRPKWRVGPNKMTSKKIALKGRGQGENVKKKTTTDYGCEDFMKSSQAEILQKFEVKVNLQ